MTQGGADDSGQRVTIPADAAVVRARRDAGEILIALNRGDWRSQPAALKAEGLAGTWRGVLGAGGTDRDIVLKRIPERAGLKRWVHRLGRLSLAMRQWRGAELLLAAGVRTSRPLLIARGRQSGAACEWLVLEAIEGVDALRSVAEGATDQRGLATALGSLVRQMASKGVRNRDHKLSNLIVMPDGGLAVIDTVGVRRGADGEHAMLLAMLKEAHGVGVLPRASLLMRVLHASVDDPKDHWRRLENDLARAGDTRPRVDPLA